MISRLVGILPDILGICKFFVYNGFGLPELVELVSSLVHGSIARITAYFVSIMIQTHHTYTFTHTPTAI